ncbi:MAG: SHD1 domain-containing protein [Pirellula sp.]|nr:SHD1 domain-containing protein [Pirellula sp.]
MRPSILLMSCFLVLGPSVGVMRITIADEPKGPLSGFAVPRQWSDKSGKFKIQAKLKFANEDEVQLLKDDDKVVTVPMNKLSEPDRVFVDSFLKAEAALKASGAGSNTEEDSENPFAGGAPSSSRGKSEMPKKGRQGAEDSSSAGQGLEQRTPNTKGMKQMTITPAKEFWSLPELKGFPDVSFDDLVLQTPMPKPFFAAMRTMAAGKSGNLVLNTYQQGREPNENYSKFLVVNVSSGDTSEILELDQPWKLMAMSPDGSRAAAVRVIGFDKGNDVALFKVSPDGLTPEFQFTAGGGSWDELHFVAFAPGNQLITISQKSTLTYWDLNGTPGPKAVRRGSTGGALAATMSPAGEVMAFPMGNSIAIVDNASGKMVGCVRREQPIGQVAFSSNGQFLAIYSPFSVTILNTQDGKQVNSFPVSDGNPQTEVLWVGAHLMVGPIAYDVERGVPLWTYEGNPSGKTTLGSYLVTAFGGDKETATTVFRIPHEEAIRASKDLDPAKIFAIAPGDAVAVQYNLMNVPADQQQAIRTAVETKINDLGWRLSSSASNTIMIQVAQGKQEEAEYYTHNGFGPAPIFAPPGFGPPIGSGPPIKVQYIPWNHSITIQADGKQIFAAQFQRGAPQNLQTNDGESTQQAVNRHCQPYADYFKNAAIPPHLLKSEYQGGLGKSVIDGRGMH